MEVALKEMVIDTLDNIYVFSLHNVFIWYMVSSTRDIMNHLMDQYGRITMEDTKMNKNSLQEPLDMSQPIDVFLNLINDAVRYTSNSNTPLKYK